jgi:hypothetical protein
MQRGRSNDATKNQANFKSIHFLQTNKKNRIRPSHPICMQIMGITQNIQLAYLYLFQKIHTQVIQSEAHPN